jgi:squalene-hopene/tetraprenyl-beta-curcumene cyclase
MHRRDFIALATLGISETACRLRRDPLGLAAQTDRALAAATRFLVSNQSRDGSWRSNVYGDLSDGLSLTPPILKCLFYTSDFSRQVRSSFRKGFDYLLQSAEDVRAGSGADLLHPVHTASLASVVIGLASREPKHLKAQSAWLDCLLRYRFSRDLGWAPGDGPFGGWGYASRIPEKPKGAESPYEANISATIFGIGALRQAGVPSSDPVCQEVLGFVKRAQNFADDGLDGDPRFDDGGFFFTPCDPARNKAGVAGTDRSGRERYNSYGSATADGLRALLRCGLPRDSARVQAAYKWLANHFSVRDNPGAFPSEREVLRNATYFYYCWSLAHALTAMAVDEVRTNDGLLKWAEVLAEELIRRQQHDGSWINRFTDSKEDDPLVATSLAAAALTHCHWMLRGERKPPSRSVS